MKSILKNNIGKTRKPFCSLAFKILFLLMLTASITSCSNSDDNPRQERIRLISYSRNSTEMNYTYDEENRLKSYQNLGINNGVHYAQDPVDISYDTNGRIIENSEYSYTYNTQGRISLITDAVSSAHNCLVTYNNLGLVALIENEYREAILEYDSNGRLIIVTVVDVNGFWQPERNTLTYDANDNIIQKRSAYSTDDGATYEDDVKITNYTYDSKNNPFYNVYGTSENSKGVNIVPTYPSSAFVYHNWGIRIAFYSKNNLLSVQYNDGTSIYEYVYNENDYPSSAEIEYTNLSDPSQNGTRYRTWTYEPVN